MIHDKLRLLPTLLLSDVGVWVSWFWYITDAEVYLVPVPTCPKRSNISHNALELSHTHAHTISVHTQQMPIVVFSFKKAPLNKGVSEERGERCMCWVLSGVWSQGERGPTGPPGIQGETGIGLPGPKVKSSSEYSCFPSAYVCCLHFLGFVLFNIISAQSAGWHWIPRPAWSTWAYWNRWTGSSCEFNVVFLSWSSSLTLHRLDDLSTPLTFIYRDLKDRKVFRVVKDRQVKACLDPR